MTKRSYALGLRTRRAVAGVLIATGATSANADNLTYRLPDESFKMKAGPGSDVAQNTCLACHSGDYITTQPPARGQAFWDAEVTKMIKVYHAVISDADAKVIADYLAKTY